VLAACFSHYVSVRFDVIISVNFSFLFFFFQAEDGIRDLYVTGVQTCALPISATSRIRDVAVGDLPGFTALLVAPEPRSWTIRHRSEERRVGKECRSRWSPDH